MDNFKKLKDIVYKSSSWEEFKSIFIKEFPDESELSEFAKKIEKAVNFNPKDIL